MAELSQKQRNFLRLILRSPDAGDGWRAVSKILTPITKEMISENPELFESRDTDETFYIRLSERGGVLADYL